MSKRLVDSAKGDESIAVARLGTEDDFRATFEQAAVGISIMSLDGRFIRVNAKCAEILGYQQAEMIGMSVSELHAPEAVEANNAFLRGLAAGRIAGGESREKQVLRKDHSRIWVAVASSLVSDEAGNGRHIVTVIDDISARKGAEEELRRFRAAMDMSVDAVFLTDRATMRFVDVNKSACAALGYSRQQLLELGPHEVHRVSKAQLESTYDEVIAMGPRGVLSETSYPGADGTERWTELHRRALRKDESCIIVTIARDVTERKSAERRRAEHLRRQEKIARFGQSALAKREARDLIDDALQTILEGVGSEIVAYFESDPSGTAAVLRSVIGIGDAAKNSEVLSLAGSHLVKQAFERGDRIMTGGEALGLKWTPALASCCVLVPVRSEQKVRGAVLVAHREPHKSGTETLNFIDAVTSVLSTALQRIESEARLSFLAQFDGLTGLPNRSLLADRFTQAAAQAGRHGKAVAILFIDIDDFKLVNDSLGHAAGDELLKECGRRLEQSVRAGDTVARIAGDEFVILLGDLAGAADAGMVAQKILTTLAEPFVIREQEMLVTASVGVAAYPADGADAESVLAAADAAMYRAKQSGRNRYEFFTLELNQRIRARLQIATELRRALERREFQLYYQPKFDLRRRTVHSVEALIRWQHPSRGTIPPGEFIPVLEESGLIVQVGEWVLRQACADLQETISLRLDAVPVAVNLSPRQFRDAHLADRITTILAEAGVNPRYIELEITESQLMNDPEQAIGMLRELRQAGIGIAVDDFGTGFSSLAYLTQFPVTALKVDRSFVSRALEDEAAATIVRTIIEMAHTLGFNVIAEGVETEGQAAFLRGLRCDLAQGYLFAHPMPVGDFRELLSRSAL